MGGVEFSKTRRFMDESTIFHTFMASWTKTNFQEQLSLFASMFTMLKSMLLNFLCRIFHTYTLILEILIGFSQTI